MSKNYSTALKLTSPEEFKKDKNDHRRKAIGELSKVILNNPNSTIAFKLRGTIYFELQNYQAAYADFLNSLKSNSEDDSVYNLLGMTELQMGDKVSAIKNFEKAIQINPQSQQAFFNRGRALYALGKPKEAIDDFKVAIKIDAEQQPANKSEISKSRNIDYQLSLIKKALSDLQEIKQ